MSNIASLISQKIGNAGQQPWVNPTSFGSPNDFNPANKTDQLTQLLKQIPMSAAVPTRSQQMAAGTGGPSLKVPPGNNDVLNYLPQNATVPQRSIPARQMLKTDFAGGVNTFINQLLGRK